MTKITSALFLLLIGFNPAHADEPFIVLQNNSNTDYDRAKTYKVERGDTLAKIVARFYPNNTELAELFRQIVSDNPHAFIRMNPNMLLAGKVLKMPNASGLEQDRNDDIYFF